MFFVFQKIITIFAITILKTTKNNFKYFTAYVTNYRTHFANHWSCY